MEFLTDADRHEHTAAQRIVGLDMMMRARYESVPVVASR